jgi:hypothetical protein
LKEKKGSHQSICVEPIAGCLPESARPNRLRFGQANKAIGALFSKLAMGLNIFIQMQQFFQCRRLSIDTLPCVVASHFSEEFTLEHAYGVKH